VQSKKQRKTLCCANIAQQYIKHCFFISTVLIINLKHGITEDAMKKITSILARVSTIRIKENRSKTYRYAFFSVYFIII